MQRLRPDRLDGSRSPSPSPRLSLSLSDEAAGAVSAEEERVAGLQRARQGTPPRPPYSPVTPVFTQLVPVYGGTPIAPPSSPPLPASAAPAPAPAPVPISESENPDAIALRSAISILQIQKQQSLRDIQALDRLKRAVADDPEGFAHDLLAGKVTPSSASARRPGDGADEVLVDVSDSLEEPSLLPPPPSPPPSRFGTLPSPQNVVRMPPINWAKYHIVGEPLERMHEEQRQRPFSGEPQRDTSMQRAPAHMLAAPYRPLVDKLESPPKTRTSTTKVGRKP